MLPPSPALFLPHALGLQGSSHWVTSQDSATRWSLDALNGIPATLALPLLWALRVACFPSASLLTDSKDDSSSPAPLHSRCRPLSSACSPQSAVACFLSHREDKTASTPQQLPRCRQARLDGSRPYAAFSCPSSCSKTIFPSDHGLFPSFCSPLLPLWRSITLHPCSSQLLKKLLTSTHSWEVQFGFPLLRSTGVAITEAYKDFQMATSNVHSSGLWSWNPLCTWPIPPRLLSLCSPGPMTSQPFLLYLLSRPLLSP